jgi:photosystem II stability/assembly factor-like uncharacterized protein
VITAATALIFGLAMAALVLPLIRRPRSAVPVGVAADDEAVEEREAALDALRELDFDHAVGKLAEEDYRALRDRYERRALALLRATDPERAAAVEAAGPPSEGAAARVPAPLEPVLDGGMAARALTRPADYAALAAPIHRNGKDHSLSASAAPLTNAGRRDRAAGGARGRRAGLVAVGVAALFVVGVGAVYVTGNRAQSDQRPVATLEGIGPRALSIAPAGRAFLASAAGLWTSAEGGSDWQAIGALDSALRGVALSATHPARVYAVGPGLLARSEDGGRGWVQQPARLGELFPLGAASPPESAGAPADLRALAVDPTSADRLWTVVEGVGVFRSDDGGQSWFLRGGSPPANVTALSVVADPAGESAPLLFLASATEGVLATADEGSSWAPASGVLNGALPTRRVSSLAYDAESGETATTPDGRTLRGTLYAGTDQGLFKSVDRGQSWSRLPLAASIAAVGVAAGDSRVVLAVDRDGRVYRSQNRGVTWDGS